MLIKDGAHEQILFYALHVIFKSLFERLALVLICLIFIAESLLLSFEYS
jgi:hypothetical protein